jgi:hypothetical protein
MNATVYGVLSERISVLGEERVTYGIALCRRAEGECEVVDAVRDLGGDRGEVEHLAAVCNRLALSAVHFRDVVEDFLAR